MSVFSRTTNNNKTCLCQDSDSELAIWPKGMGKFEIEFSKDKVDLFAIQRLLASKMLPAEKICRVTIPEGVLPGDSPLPCFPSPSPSFFPHPSRLLPLLSLL